MSITVHLKTIVLLAVLVVGHTAIAKVIYVDDDAQAAGDGTSWATAFRFLQDALSAAGNNDDIWVAAGVYQPDRSEANPTGTGLQTDTFTLKENIHLYGGLDGTEDPTGFNLEDRSITDNESVLSGDLSGNDAPGLTDDDLLTDTSRSENAYHVLKGTGITNATIIDGFTITGGQAMGTTGDTNKGGALLNSNNSNPQIRNCTFIRNAAQWGSVFYNYRSSNNTENTYFVYNASVVSGVIHNGVSLVEMVMTDCVFENNYCEGKGGAIYNNNNALIRLEHCALVNNTVWKLGNTRGGAIANENDSQTTLTYCTVAGNVSDNEGGGIHIDGGTVELDSCILWNNQDDTGTTQSSQVFNLSGTLTVDYSCVMGWDGSLGGTGNFGQDPLLADLSGGDVHLQSQAGRWDPAASTWVSDAADSSCIDAGNPAAYYSDEPLGNGGRINIGVYGGTSQASKTDLCVGGIDGTGRLLSDLDGDCRVNLVDFAWFTSEWLMSTVQ